MSSNPSLIHVTYIYASIERLCMVCQISLVFFFHKLENQLQERNQNTTTLGVPTQIEGKTINDTHMGPNLPRDH